MRDVDGERRLFATDPWGQDCLILQSGQAGDFPMSMGMCELQLPVHPGKALLTSQNFCTEA